MHHIAPSAETHWLVLVNANRHNSQTTPLAVQRPWQRLRYDLSKRQDPRRRDTGGV